MITLDGMRAYLKSLGEMPRIIYTGIGGPNEWWDEPPEGIKYILDEAALDVLKEKVRGMIADAEQRGVSGSELIPFDI